MTDDQFEKLLFAIESSFIGLNEKIDELIQMTKAVGIAVIECPKGTDATTALEAINSNFDGA